MPGTVQETGAMDEETKHGSSTRARALVAGAEQGGGRIRMKAGDWRMSTEKHRSVRQERPL